MMVAIVSGLLLLLWVTKVFIAPPPAVEFIGYVQPTEIESENEKEYKDISGGAAPTAPPVPSIIVSADVSADTSFTMEFDPVDMNMDSFTNMSSLGGDGLGDGIGEGSGRGGMGGGKKVDSAFLGLLWDLKRKPDGKDSTYKIAKYGNNATLDILSRFFNKNWDLANFANFFRAKQQLYSTCFYMPNALDKEACNAYDPTGKQGLMPGRWVAIYRAKVRAPMSGTIRFVGFADTVMAVRFNGENVLACGLHNLHTAEWGAWTDPDNNPKARQGRELIAYKGCEAWNDIAGGFTPGKEFSVKEGEWYEMQVMVSEIGGGEFGFCLLLDEMNADAKKRTKDGKPLYQLFRTAFSAPTAKETYESIKYKDDTILVDPPYDMDSRIWQAKPQGPEVKMK